jgi:HTH-type transcriptional regulator / antitoxin HigA
LAVNWDRCFDLKVPAFQSPRPVSGLAMLKYVLEENGLTGDDLANILGVDRSVAYRILKGERDLTTAHVKALRDRFGVSADVFV